MQHISSVFLSESFYLQLQLLDLLDLLFVGLLRWLRRKQWVLHLRVCFRLMLIVMRLLLEDEVFLLQSLVFLI